MATRDPRTGILTLLLTTGRVELLPSDWLVWRDRHVVVVDDEVFRTSYAAE